MFSVTTFVIIVLLESCLCSFLYKYRDVQKLVRSSHQGVNDNDKKVQIKSPRHA